MSYKFRRYLKEHAGVAEKQLQQLERLTQASAVQFQLSDSQVNCNGMGDALKRTDYDQF